MDRKTDREKEEERGRGDKGGRGTLCVGSRQSKG